MLKILDEILLEKEIANWDANDRVPFSLMAESFNSGLEYAIFASQFVKQT
jgi:hypothetical protein